MTVDEIIGALSVIPRSRTEHSNEIGIDRMTKGQRVIFYDSTLLICRFLDEIRIVSEPKVQYNDIWYTI